MDVFTAMADPVRRAVLFLLRSGPKRVVDLTAELTDDVATAGGISRPAVSRHLRVLGQAGLVTAEDRGRERHYRLTPDGLLPVRAFIAALTPDPPIAAHLLDGLELEVRRTVREHRAGVHTTAHAQEDTA